MTLGNSKKRHRTAGASDSRHSSTIAVIDSSFSDKSVAEVTQNRHCRNPSTLAGGNSLSFNDSSTAGVVLRLFVVTASSNDASVDHAASASTSVYLYSDIVRRSMYFSALLSDRWIG